MAHSLPNIDFERHEREAMAGFKGQNVYSTGLDAYGYANLRVYNADAAARLALAEALFTIHPTVAADVDCYELCLSNIKISGRFGIIICRPGTIGSMVHLNASDEKIILKHWCVIRNEVYIGPGVVIGTAVHVHPKVKITGDTEINDGTIIERGVNIGWNVRIGANVSIGQKVIIGRNVVIGELAVIEMGVVIEDNVRVGARAKVLRQERIKAGTRVEDNATYPLR